MGSSYQLVRHCEQQPYGIFHIRGIDMVKEVFAPTSELMPPAKKPRLSEVIDLT